MQIQDVTIVQNQKVSFDYYKMSFVAKGLEAPVAGQFLTIKLPSNFNQILRLPFAYSDFYTKNGLSYGSIIYQLRGGGTKYLSTLSQGCTISILGPLGSGFPLPSSNYKQVYCIAGGVGLAPILFTYNQFKNAEKKYGYKTALIAGFKSDLHIPTCDKISKTAYLCCDDGSKGYKGNVVNYLKTIPTTRLQNSLFFGCGPMAMMRGLYSFCKENNFDLYLSLEEMMGCGVGACMGCIVKTKSDSGYERVCKEGPVFNANILDWN